MHATTNKIKVIIKHCVSAHFQQIFYFKLTLNCMRFSDGSKKTKKKEPENQGDNAKSSNRILENLKRMDVSKL